MDDFEQIDGKTIRLYYYVPDNQSVVFYFSTQEQTDNDPANFKFVRDNSSWILQQDNIFKCIGILNNNDELAENILDELNQGEIETATTLEIRPFTYRNINFTGYTYETPTGPILKGGRRKRRKSKRRKTRKTRKTRKNKNNRKSLRKY